MILQKIGFFFRSVLALILFSALGVAIGILAVFAWIRLESTGIFVRWKLLESPHSFQHLINANQIELLAQTEDGKYYLYDSNHCDGTTDQKCGEWVEWPLDRELNSFRDTIVESECKSAFDDHTSEVGYSLYAKPRYLPQNESDPRECFISLELYPSGGETLTYYLLLENGKVWKWIDKSPAMQHLGTAGLFALVGLVIGILIWIRFLNFGSPVLGEKSLKHDTCTALRSLAPPVMAPGRHQAGVVQCR